VSVSVQAAFTLSFFLVPSLDDERLKRPRAQVGVAPVVGGAAFRLKGEF